MKIIIYLYTLAVNGGFGEWKTWATCESTCTRKRTRDCDDPAPAYGGKTCSTDDLEDTQKCTDGDCKGNYLLTIFVLSMKKLHSKKYSDTLLVIGPPDNSV